MNKILQIISNLSVLVFILSSMFAMGLNLTMQEILKPLKNGSLILLALLANFILVPLLAFLILSIIPLDNELATGIIILSVAAGAPFLPKLAQSAKGSPAFSVGLMVLLMVATVIYLPIVLPFLLPGASIDSWSIAKSLIFLMLLPLGIGLFIKAKHQSTAKSLQPNMSKASNMAIITLVGSMLVLYFESIIGIIGTGGLLAMIIFLLGSLVIGWLAGGKELKIKSVMSLGTGQRNISAGILVASQNFSHQPNTLMIIIVTAVLGLIVLTMAGRKMGNKS